MADTTRFYTDGEAYERLMGQWSRAAGDIFLDWLSLPQRLRWLDVGCGTGAFTELVIERCAPRSVDAIDPAEDQITYARSQPAATSAMFRVGDAQSLPFADGTFDVAAMALVITFVPDPAKAVHEMRRVVKPGGTVATYMWDFFGRGFTQQPFYDAFEAMNLAVPAPVRRESSRLDVLEAFFRAAGFDRIETRVIEITVSYPNFDDYWASQTGLGNTIVQAMQKMSAPEMARFKAHLQEHLPTDAIGGIAYPARANAVRGCVPA